MYYSQSNNLSRENTRLNQQVVSLSDNPSTTTLTETTLLTMSYPYPTTITEIQTSTVSSITTLVSTYTTTNTITFTTATSLFPPSNSTYLLTFVSGNATSASNYGITNYAVNLTYEAHGTIPTTLLVWVRFPNGGILQASPTVFRNQAYLTLNAGYSTYNFPNLVAWVTDSANNVLSPSTNLTIS